MAVAQQAQESVLDLAGRASCRPLGKLAFVSCFADEVCDSDARRKALALQAGDNGAAGHPWATWAVSHGFLDGCQCSSLRGCVASPLQSPVEMVMCLCCEHM